MKVVTADQITHEMVAVELIETMGRATPIDSVTLSREPHNHNEG